MKELDVVKLIKEFSGLSVGTIGTIVNKYNDNEFEVEFFDEDGNTIGVIITPIVVLELINKESF